MPIKGAFIQTKISPQWINHENSTPHVWGQSCELDYETEFMLLVGVNCAAHFLSLPKVALWVASWPIFLFDRGIPSDPLTANIWWVKKGVVEVQRRDQSMGQSRCVFGILKKATREPFSIDFHKSEFWKGHAGRGALCDCGILSQWGEIEEVRGCRIHLGWGHFFRSKKTKPHAPTPS